MKLRNKVKPSVPQLEPGTYFGVCVGVYAIGEQESTFNGKTKYVEQIIMTFEIPSETVEVDGEQKPRHLSTRPLTASTSENGNFRKFLRSWRGRDFSSDDEMLDFEIKNVLGKSAMLNVVQNDKGYSNIDAILPLPKGVPDPTTSTALMTFDVEEWDDEQFKALPEWIQEKIQNSTQYRQEHAPDCAVDFPKTDDAEEPEVTGVPF